ncbi:hypothetical protein [Pseudanabaena sp. Chao 1811]|uniref:hypothetical protein n=1 Tax=Pseudanabaena sp. Chao 1811 TaxID=2963092 RepID=UPI0022F3CE66|nr:hypothetical protein [Pseudanabaena sp. Chao 1811]
MPDVSKLRQQKLDLEAKLISLKLDGKEKTLQAEKLKEAIDVLEQHIATLNG